MNIYEWMHAVTDSASMHDGEVLDGHSLINELQRQNAFGTIVKITSGSHRWTRQSPVSNLCGLCGKPELEHDE